MTGTLSTSASDLTKPALPAQKSMTSSKLYIENYVVLRCRELIKADASALRKTHQALIETSRTLWQGKISQNCVMHYESLASGISLILLTSFVSLMRLEMIIRCSYYICNSKVSNIKQLFLCTASLNMFSPAQHPSWCVPCKFRVCLKQSGSFLSVQPLISTKKLQMKIGFQTIETLWTTCFIFSAQCVQGFGKWWLSLSKSTSILCVNFWSFVDNETKLCHQGCID